MRVAMTKRLCQRMMIAARSQRLRPPQKFVEDFLGPPCPFADRTLILALVANADLIWINGEREGAQQRRAARTHRRRGETALP
jgi:hypothetical protein